MDDPDPMVMDMIKMAMGASSAASAIDGDKVWSYIDCLQEDQFPSDVMN